MEYSPLDTDANEIRLLTLLSNDENDRIYCTLKHISLINPPEYVALSYRWGDPSITKEISINGALVQVTSNLESALRHLFCHYKCLWVDAICINQQDKAERSQQLLWMGSIYRRAEKVAAWIGQEADDSHLAVDFIQNFQFHSTAPGVELQVEANLQPATYSALMWLLDQEYWRRVWVIQEIALSRSTMVHCGHLYFPWRSLALIIDTICKSHASGSPPPETESDLTKTLAMTLSVLNIWNLSQFNMDAFESKPVRFFEALQRSLDALSTEPRDKVFALLGLVYDSAMYLPVPNYRQSLREISIGMAISGISTTRSLDLVPFLGCGCDDSSDLPSWAPCWFQLDQKSSHRQLRYLAHGKAQSGDMKHGIMGHRYAAAGQTMAKVQISNEVLHSHGFQFDEVDGLTRTFSEGGRPLSIRNMSRFVPETDQYEGDGYLTSAAFRALSLGWGWDLSRIPRDVLTEVLREYLQVPPFETDLKSETSLLQSPHSWSVATGSSRLEEHRALTTLELLAHGIEHEPRRRSILSRAWEERRSSLVVDLYVEITKTVQETLKADMRYMTTKKGYIGWAHAKAEQGDAIFLLSGCSVPVILRARAEGGYTVVGDAYVQGIMDGEAVRDSQSIPWTHIEIH